jgi:hypothetical protein
LRIFWLWAAVIRNLRKESNPTSGRCHFNPSGRVVARFFFQTHPAIYPSRLQALGKGRVDQEVVDAQATVSFGVLPKVIPESVDPFFAEDVPERISPALREELLGFYPEITDGCKRVNAIGVRFTYSRKKPNSEIENFLTRTIAPNASTSA